MSIVTEALASSGTLAKDDLATKIAKLSNHAFNVKQELFDFTEQCFIDFYPLLSSTEHIHTKLLTLKTEVDNLQLSLDSVVKNQIKDSTKEYEQLSKDHGKTLRLVAVLEKLYNVHAFLKDHNLNITTKNLHSAAASLDQIESCSNDFGDSALLDSKICQAINTEFVCKKENLLYILDEIWKDCISIAQGEEEETVKLSINFDKEPDSFDPQDFIYAMYKCGMLERKMKKLSELLMKNIVKPCISNYSLTIEAKGKLLFTKHEDKQDTKSPKEIPVFEKLKIILEFLHDHLLKYRLSPSGQNNETVMSMFRLITAEDLINTLVEKCLMKSVPESNEGLQDYVVIERQVREFEKMMLQVGFLEQGASCQLVDFVSNIHSHFANQRCTAVLAKARALMKLDLHETIPVEPCSFQEIPEDILKKLKSNQATHKQDLVKKAITTVLKPSKPMDDITLCLPRFRVSRGTKELIDLAYETVNEAATSTAECVLRLVSTTQNIFEIYAAVVPVYHKDALNNLPQISALQYNNCWYIAHHLLTMGHQFSSHLPTAEIGVPLTFVHQVPTIRQLGCDCFLLQMRRQRDILLEILTPLKQFSNFPNKNKFEIAEKPIKQVFHVLTHLRNVWSEVLPVNVMQTSLATLADCAVTETVNSICALEDISSEDSTQYHNICRFLRDETTSLLGDEERDLSWQRQVKKWQRLSELMLVLDSSLRGIVDRWSEGKGPLALVFTVIEVKGLIRALFQNTEQRSKAISKIRY